MNYEIAKQLRDAGFPNLDVPDLDKRSLRWPTLSQLIEACGYGFRSLSLHSNGRWIAKSGANTGKFLKTSSSPEEAVAKLWLELKKKYLNDL